MKVTCPNCKGKPHEPKCSSRCNPENCACGGLDFNCVECDGKGEIELEGTPLDLYLDIKRQIREATEAILKDAGLNWRTYGELEHKAQEEFENYTGIKVGKYTAVMTSKPIRQYKEADSKIIGYNKHIKLHG